MPVSIWRQGSLGAEAVRARVEALGLTARAGAPMVDLEACHADLERLLAAVLADLGQFAPALAAS